MARTALALLDELRRRRAVRPVGSARSSRSGTSAGASSRGSPRATRSGPRSRPGGSGSRPWSGSTRPSGREARSRRSARPGRPSTRWAATPRPSRTATVPSGRPARPGARGAGGLPDGRGRGGRPGDCSRRGAPAATVLDGCQRGRCVPRPIPGGQRPGGPARRVEAADRGGRSGPGLRAGGPRCGRGARRRGTATASPTGSARPGSGSPHPRRSTRRWPPRPRPTWRSPPPPSVPGPTAPGPPLRPSPPVASWRSAAATCSAPSMRSPPACRWTSRMPGGSPPGISALLADCHDAREHRARHAEAVARIAAFAELEQALKRGDAVAVKRLARDREAGRSPRPGPPAGRDRGPDRQERTGRAAGGRRSAAARPRRSSPRPSPALLVAHAAEFAPYRDRIAAWVDQRLQQGDVLRPADPMFLPDAGGTAVTARWAWAQSRLVRTCLVATDTARFLERPEDARRGTLNLDPDTHRRAKGGTAFVLPPGCRKLYVTVWPVVDLGWDRRVGPPFRIGPYVAAGASTKASKSRPRRMAHAPGRESGRGSNASSTGERRPGRPRRREGLG